MKLPASLKLAALALASTLAAQSAFAAIIISEVDAAGSATSTYANDWFELTNTGSAAVDITGWKIDDNSNAFGSAVALRGVTSIAAGQSVVFIESNASGSNDASIDAAFMQAWFGSKAPANLVIGNYGGSGVGLSQTSDAVNIFTSTGTLVTRVDFGASALGNTFDNAAGLNNVTLTTFSAAGVHGAFTSANGVEVGSPGTISAVPEPTSLALLMASMGVLTLASMGRQDD
ncbi:MAG: lamin tail domain-containing protein [Burkholderiales bacterium]|jgi:hypothetical protein|nr:MAG: lamin tail domain-containing protein [Burkholderiales bacterium]